jgi:Major capsid protein 13-like
MATGTLSDFVIYNDEFQNGQFETLQQNLAVFNEASGGAITLTNRSLQGHYAREAFIREAGTFVARRDPSSVAAVTDSPLQQAESVSVKLNRRFGPVSQTRDAWRKIASDPQTLSFILGQRFASDKTHDQINRAIMALVASIGSNNNATTGVVENPAAAGSNNSITHAHMIASLARFGDAGDRITAWVMHSRQWYDLLKGAVADKITDVANVAIFNAQIGSLNRRVIVTDSTALTGTVAGTGGYAYYNVLGLTANAVSVIDSEEDSVVADTVTGLANIVDRVQGEFAYNVNVKGYAYQTAAGTNPDDATLGATASWAKVSNDNKNTAGVLLRVRAAA